MGAGLAGWSVPSPGGCDGCWPRGVVCPQSWGNVVGTGLGDSLSSVRGCVRCWHGGVAVP